MQGNRTEGQAATFTIDLTDISGAAIQATSGVWTLFDDNANQLATDAIVGLTTGSTSAVVTIPADNLTIDANTSSAGREITLTLQTANGAVEITDYFVLMGNRQLTMLSNTLLTYPQALALRQEFAPLLDGWDAAPDSQRQAALINAYRNLDRIAYRLRWNGAHLASSYAGYGTGMDDWFSYASRLRLSQLTPELLPQLPVAFLSALKRAQITEADVLLGGDVVGKTREDGIISETIGDSSMFFNSKPFMRLPVSRRTFEILKPYVGFNTLATR